MANEAAVDVDLRALLKKYMERVVESEGVYFLYDGVQSGEDPPFTRDELRVLNELQDELGDVGHG